MTIRHKRTRRWRKEREDRKYLAWIRTLACLACTRGPCVPHHEPPKGLGGGSDWHDRKTIPLCAECHIFGRRARHHYGSLALWERLVGISVAGEIARLQQSYASLSAKVT